MARITDKEQYIDYLVERFQEREESVRRNMLDSIENVRLEEQGNAGYLLLRGCSEQIPLSRKAYSELKKAMETNGLTFR